MVIALYRYRLPLDTPKWKVREGLILQTETGWGEIAPLPGFSKETLDEALTETLHWIQTAKPPSLPSVRWGIACTQRSLKSFHLPLSALGFQDSFPTVKLKLGHLSLSDALILVRKYYQKARLRLDFNRSWPLEQALAFARHFSPTDFDYLEEPVPTFSELVQFSERTRFPIALDEQIHADWALIPSLKTIVVKPMIVGHIPPIPEFLNLVLSSSYESGLGLLHIANAATSQHPLGLDTYRALQDDLLAAPLYCAKGSISWKQSEPLLNTSKLQKIR